MKNFLTILFLTSFGLNAQITFNRTTEDGVNYDYYIVGEKTNDERESIVKDLKTLDQFNQKFDTIQAIIAATDGTDGFPLRIQQVHIELDRATCKPTRIFGPKIFPKNVLIPKTDKYQWIAFKKFNWQPTHSYFGNFFTTTTCQFSGGWVYNE